MRGVAVVELTIIIFAIWFMLPMLYFTGRLMYDYTVLRQAASDAALYMSSVPQIEYKTAAGAAAIQARVDQIVRNTMEAAAIRPDSELFLLVSCDAGNCGTGVTATVGVSITYRQDFNGFLSFYTHWITDGTSWRFVVVSTVPYTR